MSTATASPYREILNVSLTIENARFGAAELLQRKHYDRIAEDYEAHYGDSCSREYRQRFIYQPMFDGMNLDGMKVLDAMCGSGHTTEYLLSRGAQVTGLDISPAEINHFAARCPEAIGICRSLLDSKLAADSFDCVAVVGGLHHLHPHLDDAMREIHRVLKPGGYFCFMEPHARSIPDVVRRLWYRFDNFFSDNEAAIDIARLQHDFSEHFTFTRTQYQGGVAFLLVL
ncbi:MAG TPA: class I SAM-dependent methyltransferase, partial [Pyrinomonadaceae bacterium]